MKDTKPRHISWLNEDPKDLIAGDSKKVTVININHCDDEEIISLWAKHFRNHYCSVKEIDKLREGTGLSRKDFLNTRKFPDIKKPPGPSIRAGDFGEILVADYLQYILDYWVPRTRYDRKVTRNESTKGSDVIGFYLKNKRCYSPEDTLAIYEVKAQFSKTTKSALQKAVKDSSKDILRKAESLNAIKQRLFDSDDPDARNVIRFQRQVDHPYQELYGAVAIYDSDFFTEKEVVETSTSDHLREGSLILMAFKGKDMMKLANKLYEVAANEV